MFLLQVCIYDNWRRGITILVRGFCSMYIYVPSVYILKYVDVF